MGAADIAELALDFATVAAGAVLLWGVCAAVYFAIKGWMFKGRMRP